MSLMQRDDHIQTKAWSGDAVTLAFIRCYQSCGIDSKPAASQFPSPQGVPIGDATADRNKALKSVQLLSTVPLKTRV